MTLSTRSNPKKKILVGLGAAALVATVAVGGTAIARPGGMPGMGMMRIFHRLDLTEQQEVKAVRIRRALHEEGKGAKKEIHQAVGNVIPELEKAQPDARKLHGVADQALQQLGKIAHSGIDKFLELHATLTPEQRKVLVEEAKDLHQRAERHGDDDGPKKRGRGWE